MLSKFARHLLVQGTQHGSKSSITTLSGASKNQAASAAAAAKVSEPNLTGQLTSEQIYERESKFGAHNYHPLPVALSRGKGKLILISISNCIC